MTQKQIMLKLQTSLIDDGRSMVQIAYASGIDPSVVTKIKNGKAESVNLRLLTKLCNVLGLDVSIG